jgi:hypothetical protein
MVTREDLEQRSELVAGSPDLAELLARLRAKAVPLLERPIVVPRIKAGLSVKGGTCPACGGPLRFDPWSPDRHPCSRCGAVATGPLHQAHWARPQHLWVAERTAHLATVGVLGDDGRAVDQAKELLAAQAGIYPELPNRDNVLGPSHLFFSTYLESIWILHFLAAASILRESGQLEEGLVEAVSGVADEAARVIGEFNEGMSNRQTWNSAALTAIGVWFADDELIRATVEERTGLIGHLTDGFGADGLWHEGENYHLFALRGLLLGIQWAKAGGALLLDDPELARQLGAALLGPARTALPDLTFPARKDSRFGVSLAHPAYLECWEAGLAWLGDQAPNELSAWLEALYQTEARPGATYDAYLHDAGEPPRERTSRTDLSWWMLLAMAPTLEPAEEPWSPASALLPSQGLAVLRAGDRYVSLECGDAGGGHGHPDRLHLTVHADGVHWLPDPGAGSYVERDLFWYRSTLAHNAPLVDGRSQSPDAGAARCAAFEVQDPMAWIQGEWSGIRRSVVTGRTWLLDLVELTAGEPHRIELPWHFQGEITVETEGGWVFPDRLDDEFVSQVERFEPIGSGPIVARVTAPSGRSVRAGVTAGSLVRGLGPGLPDQTDKVPFLVSRAEGAGCWLGLVLDFAGDLASVAMDRGQATLTTGEGVIRIGIGRDDARVELPGGRGLTLGGVRPKSPVARPLVSSQPIRSEAQALRIDQPPALDGSLDGFDLGAPIELADEMHYNRSEEPYPGPEGFGARAYLNWDESALYLAVEVTKPEVVVREPGAQPLELDNEPDDIHSDGVQVYLELEPGLERALLVRPTAEGGVVARPIPGTERDRVEIRGGSSITGAGYLLTFELPCPELGTVGREATARFDLIVNEMRSDRVRRAGQLVWSGGGGWVYLRGDRHDPERAGELELVP